MASEYRFPKYDLEQSLQVARKIIERGTGATMSSHELAAVLGYSGIKNGAYLNRVAAARLFGLIDGPSVAVSVTERAERIVHADYPETEEQARIEAFRSVPLYGAFLEAFRGRDLPDAQGMVNTLVSRFRVPENNASDVLSRLLGSAGQAGLFRIGGINRMIEPTYSIRGPRVVAEDQNPPTPTMLPISPDPGARRFPKIIDGALDLMPAGPPWDESEYGEWLSFFDQACRVYYRISRGSKRTDG
jgi:hypothetical protein